MAIDLIKNKIFVEGIGDQVFIRDILISKFKISLKKDQLKSTIIDCGGFNNSRIQLINATACCCSEIISSYLWVTKLKKNDGTNNTRAKIRNWNS